MRAVFASVALFAVFASAQDIPTCAMACVAQPATLGGCSQNDMKCLCSSQEFIAATITCLGGSCPASDLEAARGVAITLCQAAGVTLDLPDVTSSGSPPAPSSTSSSSTAPSQTAESSGSGNGALSNGVNAVAGLAAIGLAALAL
ncbi:hypothetical protein ONZ45_g156 [Pleurotus djamor]|nr:hypothetical protein ONZ45_g156 [Pleurotus djamor]